MKKLLLFLGLILQVLALTASTSSIFKNLGLKEGLSNGFVNDMIIDGQGFIWAATESGLTRIAGTKCTIFKNNNSNIDNDGIVGLYYNKESNSIWILFKNGHIDVFDCKTQQFIHFTQKIPKKSVADIKGAADGGIWIAYYDGTIQHYTPKNQKFSTISNKRLPNIKNGIRSITDDGNDHLYIGLRI